MKLFGKKDQKVEEVQESEVVETPVEVHEEPVVAEEPVVQSETPVEASAEPLSRKERKKQKKKDAKKEEELIEAPYTSDDVDTVIKKSDEEAHRDVHYEIPGKVVQCLNVTMVELKRISKGSIFFVILALGLAMFILYTVPLTRQYIMQFTPMFGMMGLPVTAFAVDGPAALMSLLMFMLPFLAVFFCCSQMAHTIPEEFKYRTIFLHFALPVSKGTYYVGKFIACFIPVVVLILCGYGFAALTATMAYGTDLNAVAMLRSAGISILAAFALSSMIFAMSARKNKGSTLRGLILIVASIPLIFVVYSLMGSFVDNLDAVAGDYMQYFLYLPMCGFDVALVQLNTVNFALSPSVLGGLVLDYDVGSLNLIAAVAVYILWGLGFMFLGNTRFTRREL